jgi:hypothetical protein
MLFKGTISFHRESYKTHKDDIPSHLLLKQLLYIVTTRL